MTSATALPPVRFPLGLRFAAIAAVAVITYVVEAMWRLGALLQAFAHSLMRRPPPTGDVLGLLGGLLYWVVIAAAAGLAIALFARSRYLRLVVSIWLCALLLLGILNWAAFGPDWPTPVAICGALSVTIWLRRAERAG